MSTIVCDDDIDMSSIVWEAPQFCALSWWDYPNPVTRRLVAGACLPSDDDHHRDDCMFTKVVQANLSVTHKSKTIDTILVALWSNVGFGNELISIVFHILVFHTLQFCLFAVGLPQMTFVEIYLSLLHLTVKGWDQLLVLKIFGLPSLTEVLLECFSYNNLTWM